MEKLRLNIRKASWQWNKLSSQGKQWNLHSFKVLKLDQTITLNVVRGIFLHWQKIRLHDLILVGCGHLQFLQFCKEMHNPHNSTDNLSVSVFTNISRHRRHFLRKDLTLEYIPSDIEMKLTKMIQSIHKAEYDFIICCSL